MKRWLSKRAALGCALSGLPCRLLPVAVLLLVLAGCSASQYADSEFLGSWQAVEGEMGGVEVDLTDIDAHIALRIEASGKAVLEIGAQSVEGEWSPLQDNTAQGSTRNDDAAITLKVDDETMELTKIKEGRLKGPLGGVTLTFEQDEE